MLKKISFFEKSTNKKSKEETLDNFVFEIFSEKYLESVKESLRQALKKEPTEIQVNIALKSVYDTFKASESGHKIRDGLRSQNFSK